MDVGLPLIGELRGWARLAVSGYAAGGLATMDACGSANYDVVSTHCRAKRTNMVKHLLEHLLSRKGQPLTSTVDEALQVCEAITREQARNFFYGIRLAARGQAQWTVRALRAVPPRR